MYRPTTQDKMSYLIGLLFALLVIIPEISSNVYSCEDCERQDNRGKEFIFGFLDIIGPDNFPKVTLVGSSRRTTRVNVTVGVNIWHVTLDSHQYMKVVRIPGQTEGKAILIQADYEITVYGIDEGNSMDSFLAFPTDVLGKEYFVASYDIPTRVDIKHRGSQFLVIGVHNDTIVNIHLEGQVTYQGQTHGKGAVLVRRLSRLQSVLFLSDQEDLTGTRIWANKPIVVLSGSKCADIPRNVRYCDHLVEQLPPFSKWGKTFITTPLFNRTGGDRFRVIAGRDSTEVVLNNGERKTLNQGEFAEIDIKSTMSYVINSSQPILVMQYAKGGQADNTKADPFMMMVPAIEHFTHDVMLVTLDNAVNGQVLNNLANIIIECRQTVKLYHNMFRFPETEFQKLGKLRVSIGGTEFCMAQISLPHGVHYLDHRDQNIPFSVTLYGYGSQEAETAYGMPAGISFEPSSRFDDATVIEVSTSPTVKQLLPSFVLPHRPTTTPGVKFEYETTTKERSILKYISEDPGEPLATVDIKNAADPTVGQVFDSYNPSSDVVLSLIVGTLGFTTFMLLTMYILLLKNRIHKLKTEARLKGTTYGTSTMGPDGYMGLDGTQISHREYMSLNLPQGLFVRRSHSVPIRPALPPRMPITPLTKKNLRTHSGAARSPESSTEIELNVLDVSSVSTDLSHEYKTPKTLNLYKMLCNTPKRWQCSLRKYGRSMSESSAVTTSTDDIYMDMGRTPIHLPHKSPRHKYRQDSGFVESVSEEFFPVVSEEYSIIPNAAPVSVSAHIGPSTRDPVVASIGKRKRQNVSTVFNIPGPVLCPSLTADTYYDVDAQEYTELN
ncbi:uncharacterized protein LOC117125395 [Anneissia japonica]|uniref:uncharacterized protein LOC117125395 n=1 Tax=Anneissia japonica TaxID=1529436 RepID=UPI001425A9E3|nr:uncharacterized protein LOC117125395 [Anneissia japonica]